MTSLTILILTGKRQTLNIQERRFMKEKRTNFCRRCAQKKKASKEIPACVRPV